LIYALKKIFTRILIIKNYNANLHSFYNKTFS